MEHRRKTQQIKRGAFDRPFAPDDNGPIEGFAIAGEDGKYYKAYAESLNIVVPPPFPADVAAKEIE